ncbi:MAG: hypothetical protein HY673_08455 [Chloroflexi bacterium]|nr:hypothetical protein [Chloroflexota bacterium]
MKYVIAAIVLSLLIVRLVTLLPAEAADKRIAAGSPAWQTSEAVEDDMIPGAVLAQQPSSNPHAAQGQVVVSAEIVPIRLLVIDEEGNLAQVWSNGGETAKLEARQSGRNGPEAPISVALRAAYEQIAPTIPPGAKGLVYQRP